MMRSCKGLFERTSFFSVLLESAQPGLALAEINAFGKRRRRIGEGFKRLGQFSRPGCAHERIDGVELFGWRPIQKRCVALGQHQIDDRVGQSVAVLARHRLPAEVRLVDPRLVVWFVAPPSPAAYGRALYATLRELDTRRADRILVEEVPPDEAWSAAADRLRRAAHAHAEA